MSRPSRFVDVPRGSVGVGLVGLVGLVGVTAEVAGGSVSDRDVAHVTLGSCGAVGSSVAGPASFDRRVPASSSWCRS